MMKDVFALSMIAIKILLYPENPTMKEYIALATTLSISTSMWGKGKLSFGQALFKSL